MSFRNVFSNIRAWYNEINPATLTGAIDVIVVEQEDGTYMSSPFHVRFGKLGVLKAKEKIVDIEVNGQPVDIHMKLDDNGAAFFVEGLDNADSLEPELATSPLPSAMLTPKAWSEPEREACSRSLFTDLNGQEALEEVDDASSSFAKTKLNRSRRKRKMRPKTSKDPLFFDSAEEAILIDDAAQDASGESSGNDNEQSSILDPDVVHNSLLLSRLHLPDNLKSIIADENSNSNVISAGTSLPINILEQKVHYFSEPEMSPTGSPLGSRPGSPIMSDTEFETSSCRHGGQRGQKESEQNWEWGKLPSTTPVQQPRHHHPSEPISSSQEKVQASERRSGWGISAYLFGSQQRHEQQQKKCNNEVGVYLDDLKNDDEEMLKIYLGNRSRSNTMSRDADNDDAESGKGPSLPMSPNLVEGAMGYLDDSYKNLPPVDLSFCGGLSEDVEFSPTLFEQSKVTFDDFVTQIEQRPSILSDPSLVVRVKNNYYKWENAAPIIMSHVLYSRSLPAHLIDKLKSKPAKSGEKSVDRSKKSSWWPFGSRRERELDESNETSQNQAAIKEDQAPSSNVSIVLEDCPTPHKQRQDTTSSSSDEDTSAFNKDSLRYKKTLRLSSDAIKCLNLQKGSNEVQFSVTTAYQGTTRCFCHVYLWQHTDKIVISDIDGTITKSDVLGHVLPIIGRDWAQSGVASLFTKIVNNGYHIVYLSARAIGQASITKEYLTSIKQGELNLPDGPIFLNPTSLVNAFHREVIVKKPEEFKIACLRDIRRIFPEDKNPFYAGYGNRVNDVWAYQAVGIPMSRIFTINPKGELRHELTNAFQTSYEDQSLDVDRLYPSLEARLTLAESLGQSVSSPKALQQRPIADIMQSDVDDASSKWTPRPLKSDMDDEIFEMSSNESRPDDDVDVSASEQFDAESIYADALSRKESFVWQNGGYC